MEMNIIKQAAMAYAEKYVVEKNIDFSLEDEILDMLVDAYTAGYNDGIKDEPSPWIDISKEEPSEPTDWDVKGIIGAKQKDGFLDMWLFGYVHPDGWVRKDDLSSLQSNGVQYWMPIPQLPNAITKKLLEKGE